MPSLFELCKPGVPCEVNSTIHTSDTNRIWNGKTLSYQASDSNVTFNQAMDDSWSLVKPPLVWETQITYRSEEGDTVYYVGGKWTTNKDGKYFDTAEEAIKFVEEKRK